MAMAASASWRRWAGSNTGSAQPQRMRRAARSPATRRVSGAPPQDLLTVEIGPHGRALGVAQTGPLRQRFEVVRLRLEAGIEASERLIGALLPGRRHRRLPRGGPRRHQNGKAPEEGARALDFCSRHDSWLSGQPVRAWTVLDCAVLLCLGRLHYTAVQ